MHILIIFNHPYSKSFCNAILKTTTAAIEKTKHSFEVINLDNDNFDPVMRSADLKAFTKESPVDAQVLAYQKKLQKADHLIFIFPIWWELMPAMMKGFVDKVIFPGVMYTYANASKTRMKPLLPNIKGISVITTMNTPKILYKYIFGNAIQKALLRGTFWKLGYKNRKWINLSGVKMASDKKRKKWLASIEKRFSKL